MPKKSSAEATGGEDKKSLEFHKNLKDERIHPLIRLKNLLNVFEEQEKFVRKSGLGKDLHEYLTDDENYHWGSLEYELNDFRRDHSKVTIYLNYSPWPMISEDIILQGRILLGESTDKYSFDILKTQLGNLNTLVDITLQGREICTLRIKATADQKLVKKVIEMVFRGIRHKDKNG